MLASRLALLSASLALAAHVSSDHDEKVLQANTPDRSYHLGERFPVECLNRTLESGEHIMDASGELVYVPFATCEETGKPLQFEFGSEKDINCTIASLSDPMYHLFEFYIHNDAPLSCRVPSIPVSPYDTSSPHEYTTFQIALTGTLQLSHLHINPQLNVIMHTTSTTGKEKGKASNLEGQILAATAYSLPPTKSSPRVIIGDALPLRFTVRWYSARTLPPSTSKLSSGLGGHVHLSTVVYCILSFGGGVAVSLAYFRGIELPRRMRRYGFEKLGVSEPSRGGYAFPGKRD
ncbi:MAG: hypothetical protein GOMPHAMPRED_000848 [Gomphillus americanus]|uniref:Uncharacterized protein n=1 Tax=Gomphillus americanus TaxID=1940652 RepID=A0A8H3IJC0_9LECA|nr:MAG: hypothetical protein GOMPHAMPRED_000848 [Gomphillus americanus]